MLVGYGRLNRRILSMGLAAVASLITLVGAPAQREGAEKGADFTAAVARAEQLRAADRLFPAALAYREALALKEDWYEGWWYLGSILYELDRYDEAIPALERALVERPNQAEVLALLGLCQFEEGDYQRAWPALSQAMEAGIGRLEGIGYVARYHYALLANREGAFEPAGRLLAQLAEAGHGRKPTLREALGLAVLRIAALPNELDPELRAPVLLAGRAAAAIAEARVELAQGLLESLVRQYPRLPSVHYFFGNFLAQTNPAQALEEYEKELEISPDHLPARVEAAAEYVNREDFDAAIRHGEIAVKSHPDSFAARHVLGRAFLEAGRVNEAIGQLEAGVKLAPDSPELRFTLAQAYRAAGRPADAEREQQAFLKLKALTSGKAP